MTIVTAHSAMLFRGGSAAEGLIGVFNVFLVAGIGSFYYRPSSTGGALRWCTVY
jgi:hypothetical protein